MADITLTPTQTFISGNTVTPATLNKLAQSTVALTAGTIVDADVSASAAILPSKLGVGALPAAVTVASANLVDGTIVNADINATADIAGSKLADAGITAAKLSGAQTGAAPIYGCRAWVNFDGTTADNIGGTYSRAGTTVTVDTTVAHGLKVDHKVYLDFTSGAAADGVFTVVTAPTTTQFTVTHGTSGATSGNVTLSRRQIRASGNVASVTYHNAVGVYSVNFSTALPDENYALAGFANWTNPAAAGLVTGNSTHAPTALACDLRVANSTSGAETNVSHVSVMFIR
jgi:hypothetical protein